MSISSLNIGISGMRAYQTALSSSAHNVANASTKGYMPQTASFIENTNSGVIVNISQASRQLASQEINQGSTVNFGSEDPSGTDLATEITASLQYKAGFNFSAKIVKTADEIFATLIDLKK